MKKRSFPTRRRRAGRGAASAGTGPAAAGAQAIARFAARHKQQSTRAFSTAVRSGYTNSVEQLPISINTLGALVTTALGLYGLFLPASAASFASIIPDGELGISEVRTTYGGMFLAMGLFALVAQSPDVFRVVGVTWLGAAGARAFSVVRDNSRSAANVGRVVSEALIGLSMLLPWNTFAGA